MYDFIWEIFQNLIWGDNNNNIYLFIYTVLQNRELNKPLLRKLGDWCMKPR